jgi:hypothetical protein
MNDYPSTEPTHERAKENPREYPFEYFDAQVQFAAKWSELSGEPFEQTLLTRTALKRRLSLKEERNPEGEEVVDLYEGADSVEEVSSALYDHYLSLPDSNYDFDAEPADAHDGRRFFSYDYYPNNKMNGGRNTIKVHFAGNKRGEKSRLSSDLLPERQAELKAMIDTICAEHPEAEEVVGGSWLYAIPGYRDSFPPEFIANMKPLVPAELAEQIPGSIPNMSFTGNSVWGQFIDSHGWTNQERYQQFLDGVQGATSLLDLYEALPLKPLQPSASTEVFKDWRPAA